MATDSRVSQDSGYNSYGVNNFNTINELGITCWNINGIWRYNKLNDLYVQAMLSINCLVLLRATTKLLRRGASTLIIGPSEVCATSGANLGHYFRYYSA